MPGRPVMFQQEVKLRAKTNVAAANPMLMAQKMMRPTEGIFGLGSFIFFRNSNRFIVFCTSGLNIYHI